MAKLLFAAKTIEYEGPYGTATRKYEIRLGDIEAVALGTREKKVLFGLIKKQERFFEITTKGIMGIDAPIVYAESDEGKDEYDMAVEKLKQYCGKNNITIGKK